MLIQSMVVQVFSLSFPLLNIYIINSRFGAGAVVEFEVSLAVIIFVSMLTNFSSNLFIGKKYRVFYSHRNFAQVYILRFLLFPLSLVLALGLEGREWLVLAAFLTAVCDPGWIILGRKKITLSLVYALVINVFMCFLVLLAETTQQLLKLIMVPYISVCLIFNWFLLDFKQAKYVRLNFDLIRKYLKRLSLPTLSDLLTILFVRLDIILLTKFFDEAVLYPYIVIRKFFTSYLSILFASVKFLFLETKSRALWLYEARVKKILVMSLVGVPFVVSEALTTLYSVTFENQVVSLWLFFLVGSIAAYLKNKVKFREILKRERYLDDLKFTVLSFLYSVLVYGVAVFLNGSSGAWALYCLLLTRATVDLVYYFAYQISR